MEKYQVTSYSVSVVSAKRGPAAIIHAISSGSGNGPAHIYLRYYRADANRPDNSRIKGDDGSLMYMVGYDYDQLAAAVDLLRNERPMFFVYNAKSGGAYLSTDVEPVGEGPEGGDLADGARA